MIYQVVKKTEQNVNKKIRFKIPILRSDLWDYIDAYIFVKGKIIVTDTSNANRTNKNLTFKNNAPFKSLHMKHW